MEGKSREEVSPRKCRTALFEGRPQLFSGMILTNRSDVRFHNLLIISIILILITGCSNRKMIISHTNFSRISTFNLNHKDNRGFKHP
jgi:hypothetical protein